MDFYQWRYDVPGNIQGVVVAAGVHDAMKKVVSFLRAEVGGSEAGYSDQIQLEWLGNAEDGVAVIKDI